jgi:hypothetical protein
VLTEVVANSLDSGASHIALTTDAAARTLTILDDGRGMRRRELARYHDIAASAKVRGDTIGFAGVGTEADRETPSGAARSTADAFAGRLRTEAPELAGTAPATGAPAAEPCRETKGRDDSTAATSGRAAPAVEPDGAVEGRQRCPGRYGLALDFEHRPDDPELARLQESTIRVNDAHPAYRRAARLALEGYHLALATALALSPLAVEPAKEHAFVTAFLAAWGHAIDRRPRRRRHG